MSTTGIRSEYVGQDSSISTGIRILARDLARVPVELQAEIRPLLRRAGQEVLQEASVNASWSTRIPRALSLRVSFSARAPGVYIVADVKKAPHARAYEGIVHDTFRHPVFQDSKGTAPWVVQDTRPYLLPAARAGYELVAEAVTQAMETVLARAGFR